MNIIEGGFDPIRMIMLIISIVLVLSTLYILSPFFVECSNGIATSDKIDLPQYNDCCGSMGGGGCVGDNCTFGGGGGSREWIPEDDHWIAKEGNYTFLKWNDTHVLSWVAPSGIVRIGAP